MKKTILLITVFILAACATAEKVDNSQDQENARKHAQEDQKDLDDNTEK